MGSGNTCFRQKLGISEMDMSAAGYAHWCTATTTASPAGMDVPCRARAADIF